MGAMLHFYTPVIDAVVPRTFAATVFSISVQALFDFVVFGLAFVAVTLERHAKLAWTFENNVFRYTMVFFNSLLPLRSGNS